MVTKAEAVLMVSVLLFMGLSGLNYSVAFVFNTVNKRVDCVLTSLDPLGFHCPMLNDDLNGVINYSPVVPNTSYGLWLTCEGSWLSDTPVLSCTDIHQIWIGVMFLQVPLAALIGLAVSTITKERHGPRSLESSPGVDPVPPYSYYSTHTPLLNDTQTSLA